VIDRTFSSKPGGNYLDYYEKMSRYALVIAGPAAAIEPGATAMTFQYVEEPEDDSPLAYVDSAATRARITALMDKFRHERVVIAGCGRSGSYVLDLVAKTPVAQIDVYDGDRFCERNAFRSPRAPNKDDRGGPNKVRSATGRSLRSDLRAGLGRPRCRRARARRAPPDCRPWLATSSPGGGGG
jgi:hypothetical protein